MSSAIAKCCEVWTGGPPSALSAPRWETRRVVAWKASRPLSVKLNVTIGSLPTLWSEVCSGSLMSVPDRPGRSWITHQRSGRGASEDARSARRTRTPAGTSITSAFARWASGTDSSASSRVLNVCPSLSGFLVVLSKT